MNTKIILRFLALLWLSLGAVGGFAQPGENKPKRKGIILQKFKPTDSTSVLQAPILHFPDINTTRYYYNPKELESIKKFRDEKNWATLLVSLKKYVSKFGIENFKRDMDLLWLLARVAEHENEWPLAKETWRCIIKHHRGSADMSTGQYGGSTNKQGWADLQSKSLQAALHHYDSLVAFEKDLYVDLTYYYDLVERRKAIDTLHPPQSIMLNMGEGVNSNFEEYGLTISGMGDNAVYFTSNRIGDSSKVRRDLYGNTNEDIFFATKDEEGLWGAAKPFKAINTTYKEGSPCMNKAGNQIIFARCFSPDGMGNCDLYQAFKIKDKSSEDSVWSVAINLGPNINTSLWDSHPSLSTSEDTLYFASDRYGGFGGSDIYFSVKDKKGRWGPAQNIGPTINTQMSEVSPHIHPNQNVLYFSSNGHMVNFGDYDIFKSYWVKGEWTEPKNIGPLVNGKGSEIYFAIDSKAENLFYSKSHEHETHNLDLYSFPLPMEAQPGAVFRFSGKAIEPTTGEVFQGVVTIIDLDEHVEVAPKHLRDDGSFEFELVSGRRYLLLIEGDNFFDVEEVLKLDENMSSESGGISMGGESHKVVTFSSIDFDPSSAKLKPEMENNLHLVVEFLQNNPAYNCRVVGHTDSDGNADANLALSQERAEAIQKYLRDYGQLEPHRVLAVGMGDTQPLIKNATTPEDKKRNRRVEFEIFRGE